jgi:hypothetical protein
MHPIWSTAFRFALWGPLAGFFLAVSLYFVAVAGSELAALSSSEIRDPNHSEMLLGMVRFWLSFLPLELFAAYAIGAPGAFAAGMAMYIMRGRSFRAAWAVAVSMAAGAAISTVDVFFLDVFIIPRPHGDPKPYVFGPGLWLIVGVIGAVSAAICSLVVLRNSRK